MKRKLVFLLSVLCLTMALLPGTAMAATYEPAVSSNINGHDYDGSGNGWQNNSADAYHAWPTKSYLFENRYGGVTRVEYITPGGYGYQDKGNYVQTRSERIIVEEYDSRYQLVTQREIPMELPIWGGFLAGKDHYYFVFGQEDLEHKTVEGLCVVRYTKDWERVKTTSLSSLAFSIETPFEAGSLDMFEDENKLYIRSCIAMWNGHQSNTFIELDYTTDKWTGLTLAGRENGGVSHSFNQYVLVDNEKNIIALDHGDASPRGIILNRYLVKSDEGGLFEEPQNSFDLSEYVVLKEFPQFKDNHYNHTGGQVGGLAESRGGYLVPYTYGDQLENFGGLAANRSAYLAFVKKGSLEVTTTQLSTDVSGNPFVCPTSLDGGYILWANRTTGKLNYASYDANGKVGVVKEANAELSDCEPILHNGELVWYVATDPAPRTIINGIPQYDDPPRFTFYMLGENGVRTLFSDVAGSAFYFDAVNWAYENGITTGTDATHFRPDDTCTRAQIATFLWRTAGSPTPKLQNSPFVDVTDRGAFYFDAVLWAYENGITTGTDATHFRPNDTCTRAQIATFLWRTADSPEPTLQKSPFYDVADQNAFYYDAVLWAYENGITTGTDATHFSPNDDCTRGQVVTFLHRSCVDTARVHDHDWNTETIHYYPLGYEERRVVGQEQYIYGYERIPVWYCAYCKVEFDSYAGCNEHVEKNPEHRMPEGHSNIGAKFVDGAPIYKTRDVIENIWVETSPAFDVTRSTCTICGMTK